MDHIEDFIQTRRSVGRDTRYVNQLREKLLRLGRECAWSTVKDVTASIPAPQSLVQASPALSNGVHESEVQEFAGTGSSKGFAGDLAVHVHPWPMPSRNGEKSGRQFEPEAGARIYAGFPGAASQIASHGSVDLPEVLEIAAAWRGLPDVLKRAVLGIVRSAQPGDRQ